MKYGGIVLLLAILIGGAGFLLNQVGLEIAGIIMAFVGVGVFLWASVRLSLQLRPPAVSEQEGMPVHTSQAVSLDDVLFAPGSQEARRPEELPQGEYHYGGRDENKSLPEDDPSL